MSEPAVSAISTDALTKSYDGVAVLKALNINIRQHSICGFLGPNGAGKTTTIKLLLGLAKPTAGGGTIFGQDIVTESTEIRRRVGYLSQDPRYYDHMTARETLRFTARFFYRGSRAAIEDRVDEVLELVGLANKADRSIKGFSGGERQLAMPPERKPHDNYELMHCEEVKAVLESEELHEFFKMLWGEEAKSFDNKWFRAVGPGGFSGFHSATHPLTPRRRLWFHPLASRSGC